MASIFRYMSYGELIKLTVCLSLDICDYVVIFLLSSIVGDFFSIISLATTIYMFGLLGLIEILDFIPGFDLLPMATITWLAWTMRKRWDSISKTTEDNSRRR